jgi:hypothetical protein
LTFHQENPAWLTLYHHTKHAVVRGGDAQLTTLANAILHDGVINVRGLFLPATGQASQLEK